MLHVDWGAVLVQVVNFGILVYILNRFLFTPVRATLETRRGEIKKGFEDIEARKAAAAAVEAQYQERLRKFEDEVAAMRRDEIKAAQARREELVEEARAECEKMKERSRVQIETEANQVIDDLQDHVAKLSVSAAERILKAEITPAKHRELISNVIAEAGRSWRRS